MSAGAAPYDEDGILPPGETPGGMAASEVGPGTFDANLDKVLASGAVEEAPGDPGELIAAPAGSTAGQPAPESIVGAPEMGPPAPNAATDPILASLPAGGIVSAAPPAPGAVTGAASPPVTSEGVIAKEKDLDKQKAEDAILAADDARQAALDHQKETNDALKVANDNLKAKQAIHDEAFAKYSSMEPHELHPAMSSMIGVALGGLGAALSSAGGGSAENRVLTQWNKKVDDDFNRQKYNIEKARDSVVMAHTGIEDAKEAKAAMLEDASAKWLATKSVAESEARMNLAERGVPAADIDNDRRIIALGEARRQAQIENDKRQRAEAMDKGRLHLMDAQAARYDAAAARDLKKAKGGTGAGQNGKYEALTAALKASGGELTPEVAAVADRLKIKGADLRGIATQFKQERRTEIQERGEVSKDIKDWADKSGFTAASKKAIELEKLGRVLKGETVTGLDRAIVLQEMEKAAKGGTATMGGVQLDMAHLAGGEDKLNQIITKFRSGDFSSEQAKALAQSIANQADAAKAEIDSKHEDFQQTFRENPRYAADPKAVAEVNAKADAYFAQHGYSRRAAKAAGGGEKAGAAPAANPQLSGAQAWLADPKNAKSPLRGAVQAKVDAMTGAAP